MEKPTSIIIRKINVLSLAKVQAIMGIAIGLILGAIFTIISILKNASYQGNYDLIFGKPSIIVLPILYGLFGFLGGIIGAIIYNTISRFVKGIDIVVEKKKS